MSRLRFSVVIPTRERAITLRSCLQTCLRQDFDDYEVIVCDNCSSGATRQVVDDFVSPKIRYLRSAKPLAMSANWELALEQARGEYAMILGDDDGLMPYALREMDILLDRFPVPALRWEVAVYTWPNLAVAADANYLRLPLNREIQRMEARPRLAAVIRFEESYNRLPMIYNSVIHRDLIGRLRQASGRVFATPCPDVYSGFAFGYLAGTYLSVEVPMHVVGLSGHSNGVATLLLGDGHPIARDFHRLNAEAGYRAHRWVPDLPLFAAVIADSFLVAKEALFPDDADLAADRKTLVLRYLAELAQADAEIQGRALQAIRSSLADQPDLQAWFDANASAAPPAPPFRLRHSHSGSDGNSLHIDTSRFGVTDIAGAVDLCARLLGYEAGAIRYDLPSRQSQLAAVQKDSEDRLKTIHRLDALLRQAEASLAAQQMRFQERRAEAPSTRALCRLVVERLTTRLRQRARLRR